MADERLLHRYRACYAAAINLLPRLCCRRQGLPLLQLMGGDFCTISVIDSVPYGQHHMRHVCHAFSADAKNLCIPFMAPNSQSSVQP